MVLMAIKVEIIVTELPTSESSANQATVQKYDLTEAMKSVVLPQTFSDSLTTLRSVDREHKAEPVKMPAGEGLRTVEISIQSEKRSEGFELAMIKCTIRRRSEPETALFRNFFVRETYGATLSLLPGEYFLLFNTVTVTGPYVVCVKYGENILGKNKFPGEMEDSLPVPFVVI